MKAGDKGFGEKSGVSKIENIMFWIDSKSNFWEVREKKWKKKDA